MALKYKLEIMINRPREEVARLMADPANMPHWQKGFISMDSLEGEPGKVGTKSKLKYKMGKREIEMIETITKNDLPRVFSGTYDANGVHNIQENRFEEVDINTTKWISVSEFQFNNFMMRMMGWLMPGSFKKQSHQFMVDFKDFAEGRRKASSTMDAD